MTKKSGSPLLISLILGLLLLFAPGQGTAAALVCTTSWANAAGGSWDTGGNWTAGVPVASSDVCIDLAGTYTVTLIGAKSVNSVTLGNVSGVQTLLIRGSNAGGNAKLTSATGITNVGTITLDTIDSTWSSTLKVTTGALANGLGGVINVNQGAGGARTLNLVLDNRGAANFNRSTILNKASATHLNSGAFNITTPSTTVTFSGSATTFTNQVPGTITGIGTLNVSAITFTNDGTMSPGLSFGILTLNGDFTQSSSGSLNTEIGGRDPGGDFDLFNVTGADWAAALDGNLNVLPDPGFEPCVGDRFLVIPYLSHTGQFATVNGAAIDATTFFSPIYEADGVTLEVKSSVPSVPQICIVSPADGSIFNSGTTVLLQGIASDPEDGDISSSIVWTSNLQAGAGIGAELSTSQLIDGVHTITDSNGNSSNESVTVTVSDTFPTISITSPPDGTVSGPGSFVLFEGTANDTEDGDISEQIVWSSNLQAGSGTGASFSVNLLIMGVHTITATITDALGNVATDTVMVTVSNTTPTVSITNPIDGATFASGATVNFAGTASDTEDGDISSLIVWTSNLLPGLSATGANLSTNLLIDGTHIITAIITDSTGNPAIDTITITVRP